MTSKWLKNEDGEYVQGKNGNKLRYLYFKKDNRVETTFDSNWTENSIIILNKLYNNIIRNQKKR